MSLTTDGSKLYGTASGGSAGDGTLFSFAPPIPGDANEDGTVDINDLTIVLANFGQTAPAWSQGNFCGDATVDVNDLTILLSNFGATSGVAAPGAVPEPPALLLLAAAAALAALACRRRARL